MLKDIIMILSGIIGAYLFIKIRQKIINQTKDLVKEKWNTAKFLDGITNVVDKKLWGQTLSFWLNFRNWIIIGVIIAICIGYGKWLGLRGKPVQFNLDYGTEFTLKLDSQLLHKPKNSNQLEIRDEKGNIIKVISAKDIPELAKKLRPYGFKLEPIAVAGGSIGEAGAGIEAGAGVSWFKYFRWNLDSFLTTKGLYPLGTSYQITDNSGVGLGAGMGFEGDKRVIIYYKWKF